MINIKEMTEELIQQLSDWGDEFNGISIDVQSECEDEWRDCYAIFIVDIIDFDIVGYTSEYVHFDEDEFWDDLYCWISSYFDENTTIEIHRNTGEVEIYNEERMKDEP